jgi:hypothetical protein
MRDIDRTHAELVEKYGPLVEKDGDWVDTNGFVRRINHSRANGDFMDEMEAGLLCHSIVEDSKITLDELEKKYGTLTLTEYDYYVDGKGIIRRILPYTPLVR